MGRVVVGAVIVALVFTIFAVVDTALTERFRVRGLPKALWLVLEIVLPVIGGLLWFLIGRGPVRRTRFLPPDDDPAFTGGHPRPAGSAPAAAPIDDQLRLLEEELAKLDTDSDDDGDGRRH